MFKRIIEEVEDFIPYVVPILITVIIMPIMLAISIMRVETEDSSNPVYNIGSSVKFYKAEETYKDYITEDSYWIKKENVPDSIEDSLQVITEYNGYDLVKPKNN